MLDNTHYYKSDVALNHGVILWGSFAHTIRTFWFSEQAEGVLPNKHESNSRRSFPSVRG